MKQIDVHDLDMQPFNTLGNDGILLVAGDENKSNPMTISWGFFGIMWGKPVAIVAVRTTRYTYDFMNDVNEFTLNWVDDDHKPALIICGTKSGRDIDKYTEGNITPMKSQNVVTPSIKESKIILECKTIYASDLTENGFIDKAIVNMYNDDYHRLYFGEIVGAFK